MNIACLFAVMLSLFACSNKPTSSASTNSADTATGVIKTATPKAATANTQLPPCIQRRIDSLRNQPVQNPPAFVEEYMYQDMRIFVFSAPCCDNFSSAYDSDCNYVCAPSGGFTGRGDGKCPGFQKEAKLIRVVWKDDRKK